MIDAKHIMPIAAWLGAAALLLTAGISIANDRQNERLAGPIPAEILAVVDGDTVEVSATIWLGQIVVTKVRLLGIDTPEMKGKCDSERDLARQAKRFVQDWIAARPKLELRDVDRDKYGGRVTARITAGEKDDLGAALLAAGLAYAYDGKTKSPWCK